MKHYPTRDDGRCDPQPVVGLGAMNRRPCWGRLRRTVGRLIQTAAAPVGFLLPSASMIAGWCFRKRLSTLRRDLPVHRGFIWP